MGMGFYFWADMVSAKAKRREPFWAEFLTLS
jgi:hypothetical protein